MRNLEAIFYSPYQLYHQVVSLFLLSLEPDPIFITLIHFSIIITWLCTFLLPYSLSQLHSILYINANKNFLKIIPDHAIYFY